MRINFTQTPSREREITIIAENADEKNFLEDLRRAINSYRLSEWRGYFDPVVEAGPTIKSRRKALKITWFNHQKH